MRRATCHQETERDGLRIAVCKLRVVGLWEQELSPVGSERSKSRVANGHLLNDLVAQQAAEAGADFGELLCALRWNWLPSEEIADERKERSRRRKFGPRSLHVAVEVDDCAFNPAVPPQAE